MPAADFTIRPLAAEDADALAAAYTRNREHLAPWEPVREPSFFTVDGQAEAISRQLGLHRVEAGTMLHNVASQRVLLRAGFERYGMAPRYLFLDGDWRDHYLYQRILHDDPP